MAKTLTKGLFGIFIAILLVAFVNVGLHLFIDAPEYPNVPCEPIDKTVDAPRTLECGDAFEEAQAQYDEERMNYEWIIFVFSLVVGVIFLMAGLFIEHSAIKWGLLIAGIGQLLYGVMRNWDNLNEYIRFGMLGVALTIVIYFVYKKLEK